MRKKKQTYLKLMAGALILCLAGSAMAQMEDLRVDLNLKDADIVAAARALTLKTGVKFVFAPSQTPYGKITLKLDQVTPDEAIKYICTAAGATYRKDDNGVFLISHTPLPGGSSATTDTTVGDSTPAPRKTKTIKKILMRAADPYDVITQLYGAAPDLNRGWRAMSNLHQAYGGSVGLGSGNGPLGDRMNPTPAVTSPVSSKGALPQYTSEASKDIQLPGESANQFGGGEGGFGGAGGFAGGQGGFGGAGGFGGGQGGFGGGQGGLGGGVGGGQGLGNGRGLIPQSIDFLTYDPNDNAILVRGTEEDIAELQKNIALFDVAPKQVLIKLEFITTSASVTKSIGYDFNYERGPILFGAPPGTFARSSDPFFLSYSIGNVAMRLRANLNESNGKVVSAPIVRTLNNQFAFLQSQVTTNVVVATTTQTPNGLVTGFQINPVNYNTFIAVSPRINLDGTITMYLTPQVADQGQIRKLPAGNGTTQELADQLTQSVQVVVRVKNGQTIVLGGLTRKSDQGTESKYPILGDLPIIGQFFRGKQTQKNYSELLIFVTPTVVEDEENTGLEP